MDSINNLAISWDLPAVSNINRRWLAETILYHGVGIILFNGESCKLQLDILLALSLTPQKKKKKILASMAFVLLVWFIVNF